MQVTRVLELQYEEIDQVYIIDCRYPYEYEGGHIKVETKDPRFCHAMVDAKFLKNFVLMNCL